MERGKTKHKILLTGGAGFIGSHVAEAYLKASHTVAIVDNLSTGKRGNVPGGAAFYPTDIGDMAAMEKIFRQIRPTRVNHHAAQIDVRSSVTDPKEDAKQNILAGISLLELSKKHRVQKFIFASTGGALYGEVAQGAAAESAPIHPVSPYGVSKFCFEKYVEWFARFHGFDFTILRYANVFGPRQIPKTEGGVVAVFVQTLLAGQVPAIFGDGKQERDLVYVEDVAEANRLALNKGGGAAFNIGTGEATSVLTLLASLQKELKSNTKPRFAPARPGEIFRSVVDNSLARSKLGWQPRTSLCEGLKKTIAWHKKGLDKFNRCAMKASHRT